MSGGSGRGIGVGGFGSEGFESGGSGGGVRVGEVGVEGVGVGGWGWGRLLKRLTVYYDVACTGLISSDRKIW